MFRKLSACLLSLLLVLTACQSRVGPPAPAGPSEVPPEAAGASSPAVPAVLSLDEWWRDYLYDACYPLQDSYPTLPQLDTLPIIEYCGLRMWREGTDAGLEGDLSVLPRDTLDEYTRRYFNLPLSELDTLKLENGDGTAVLRYLNLQNQGEPDDSLEQDSFRLDRAEPQPDGTVALTLRTLGSDRETRFTMAPHPDGGGYYFAKVEWDYGRAAPVCSGNYLETPALLGRDASAGRTLRALGEAGGSLLLADYAHDRAAVTLSLVGGDLSERMRTVTLGREEEVVSVSAAGDTVKLLTNRRSVYFGPGFSDERELPLPAAFTEKYAGGLPAYDRTADGTLMTYANDEGLVLLDTASGTETLLVPHPHYDPAAQGRAAMANEVYASPVFTDGDARISAQRVGYEWFVGGYRYDLAAGTGTDLPAPRFGGGIDLEFAGGTVALRRSDSGEPGFSPHAFFDPATGGERAVTFPDGEVEVLAAAAAGDRLYALARPADGTARLYRYDPDAFAFSPTGFTVSGGDPDIVGVFQDGGVLLRAGAYLLARP